MSNSSDNSIQKNGTWLLAALVALLLISAGCILLYLFRDVVSDWLVDAFRFFKSKEQVRDWIMSFGAAAPLVFIGIQAMQVVFAPIPGEATGFLGGFLFGIAPGFLYSTLGLTIGSTLAFLLGRWLEIHFVEKVVSRQNLEKFDFIIKKQGALIAFLLFLIPGFPKDYLCFILGLSKMPFRVFIVINIIGRMPGTLMLTLQGANIYKGNYISFYILLGIFLVAGILVYIYKESLYLWLRHWSRQLPSADEQPQVRAPLPQTGHEVTPPQYQGQARCGPAQQTEENMKDNPY